MPMSSCLFGSAMLACLFSASVVCVQQPSASSSVKTSAAVPEIPYPSGPLGIGRIGFHWIDTSRPDNYDLKRKRELMVYFWYPTAKSLGAKGQYLPGAAQMDAAPAIHEFMSQEFGNLWAPIVSGEISSHDKPGENPNDPHYRRSYVAKVVTQRVNKIINLPVLKHHQSAGVTIALKNMSHGFVNNVNRSHLTPTLNACGTLSLPW